MPSQSEEAVIAGIREVCSAFPKSSKAVLHVVHRASDVGKFDGAVERAAVGTLKNGYSLESKSPTAAFVPGDEKALEYVRSIATSAVQSACTMVVIVDLPANQIDIHVLNKGMCFVATAACGDPFAPEVIILSAFRDEVLLHCPTGRTFIRLYYLLSPPLAAVITRSAWLRRAAMAVLIRPTVRAVRHWRFVQLPRSTGGI
jgi:hypothetical protein